MCIFLPFLTFSQLPELGSTQDFAVFTSIGALGNTGVSSISGDVGTNDGAVTGFDAPTVVIGVIESENAITAQCLLDVQDLYDELFSVTPTDVVHAPAFGNGETLPVGVYHIAAAGSVAGDLTLDAAGDPDAIFIFQFGGAFTTGASSTIHLINDASACNVFWIAEGAIAMAALTDMKGSLISNNGAVSMGAGGILEGRLLSTAGAASVYDVVISLPVCQISALSANLLAFTGACNEQHVVLNWSTSAELNNDYFTVERCLDMDMWQHVGIIFGSEYSSQLLSYTFIDHAVHSQLIYYRLKQTDFSGNSSHSLGIFVDNCEKVDSDYFTLYPNPSSGKFQLLFSGSSNKIQGIEIFNSFGQKIYSTSGFQSLFDLSMQETGIYFIQIHGDSKVSRLKYVMVN